MGGSREELHQRFEPGTPDGQMPLVLYQDIIYQVVDHLPTIFRRNQIESQGQYIRSLSPAQIDMPGRIKKCPEKGFSGFLGRFSEISGIVGLSKSGGRFFDGLKIIIQISSGKQVTGRTPVI